MVAADGDSNVHHIQNGWIFVAQKKKWHENNIFESRNVDD